ncbi:hypothetical protein Vadar_021591 [Vaccinium darrowii]|uniref:Uncharacterized protein n=1 Tax=Vaccinium darrowii TaxID=229202 RepID=A0ACB7Y225_9ERIC|nr:hypothetical protein Vadar_021591 [Vaccinium darrowii]
MMKSIPQLRELKIWGCKVLSRIVAEENGLGESSVDEVEFPQLASLKLQNLPNLVSFSPKVTTTVQPLFSGKVAIPSLKYLELQQLKNLSDLWFSELPTGSFSELKELEVIECKNLRTTFPPSMVEALANLEKLVIRNCSKMEAVVNSEEKGQGRKIDKAMFPQLKKLELHSLPNLRMFCSFTRPSDLPLLRQKDIRDCPSMDAFSLGHLSFPKLCLPGTSSKDILNHPRWFAEEQDHLFLATHQVQQDVIEESGGQGLEPQQSGVFHEVDPGKVAEQAAAATWIRLLVMGARNASTVTLDAKEQKEETRSASGVAAGSGGSDDKAIVSSWGISLGKVTKGGW